jgi:hypothetical protein
MLNSASFAAGGEPSGLSTTALTGKLLTFMLVIAFLMIPAAPAHAWSIYNFTDHDIAVTIGSIDGGSTSCGQWDNDDGIIIGPGENDGPNWSDKDCNPDGKRDSDVTFWILSMSSDGDLSSRRGRFFCSVAALAGGFVVVYDQPRPGFSSAGSVRDNRYCVSYFAEDKGYDDNATCKGEDDLDYNGDGKCTELVIDRSDYFADYSPESLAAMTPANRDVRFLATGDPQYWNSRIDGGNNTGVNETADEVMKTVRDLKQSTKQIRGVIVAGDLTQNARDDEWGAYEDSMGTMDRFFFEGLGNHDVASTGSSSKPGDRRDYVGRKARNTWPTKRNYDNGGDEIPHYSWDWHDVHFVQLNLFPGDDKPNSSKGSDLDPRDALQFLIDDLAANVGTTGRPIVLTHHYGFDSFSLDWWEYSQRMAYWNAIKDYNIVAIITGHSHSYVGAGWEVDWDVSNTDISNGFQERDDLRRSIPTFISGAARGGGDYDASTSCDDSTNACFDGVFLDIEMDYCNQMIITRKDDDGNAIAGDEAIVPFDAPGEVNAACNTPPVAVIGGPYSGTENSEVTFNGNGSYDDDGDTLEYRWDFDGNGTWDTGWSTDEEGKFTWTDDYSGTVKLEVRDTSFQATDSDSTTVTISNVDPVISSVTGDTIDEDGTATVSGDFSDVGVLDSFTVTIDWGEGSPVDYAYPVGSTGFSDSHQYLDDNPTGTSLDVYTVDVTITDDDTGDDADSTTVTVNNVNPVIGSVTGDIIDENGTATVSGTFSDVGTEDSFTVTIDWGEGSPVDYAYPAGSTDFSETHQYLDDNPTGTPLDVYTVDVSITDDDSGDDADSTTVTVNNVNPVAAIDSLVDDLTGLTLTFVDADGVLVPGDLDVLLVTASFTLHGGYTDTGTLDTHTAAVNWGDTNSEGVPITTPGTTDPVAHDYAFDATPGDYTIALTVTDDDTGLNIPTATVEVVDAAGALEDSLVKLQRLIDEGGWDTTVERALARAMSHINGNAIPNDGGDAGNGALDKLEAGALNAAMVKIQAAIEELLAAAEDDPGLDVESIIAQLAITARSVASTAISLAEDLPPKKAVTKKIAEATADFDHGDQDLGSGDYLGATVNYKLAVREVQGLL